MNFNFTFTFPEVDTLNDIVMSVDDTYITNNILIFSGPTFAKPVGEDGFLGWEVYRVEGGLSLIYADSPLTKNNIFSFDASNISTFQTYNITLYCKMLWVPTVEINYVWGNFDDDTPVAQVMTVNIDLSDSNPNTCCSYANDAIGMSAASSDWDTFFGHYPVLMKDGIEIVKLNPNNYAEDINGNAVDIESGDSGDVMIAFPRRGLNISKNGKIISISFTSDTNNRNFSYYAHTHNTDLDTFYVGAYDGYIDTTGKLRSLSGKTPTTSKTIGAFRSAAQLNGSGYEQFAYYQLVYL